MVQTIITSKGFKKETNLEALYRERMWYYKALIKELSALQSKKIDLIRNYKTKALLYDEAIAKELRKNVKNIHKT